MAPPDLSILAKREYFILYKMQKPVFLNGCVGEQSEEKGPETEENNIPDSASDIGGFAVVGQNRLQLNQSQPSIVHDEPMKDHAVVVPQEKRLSEVHPRENLKCQIKLLHSQLMKLLQLQISGDNGTATEEALAEQSKLIQEKIVEINNNMLHLRRMEGVQ